MSYRKDSFEGDELDRMRARQQRKKQGRPAAPTGDSYDLRPDQIEELDLDDYDTYESALKQELNRTIAQTKQEQKNPNRKENRNAMRQDRAVYERPRKKRKKKHSFGKILLLVVCLFAGIFLYRHFRAGGYWTIAVFGVDSRDGNLGKGALSDVEMLASINKKTGEIRLVSVFRDSYLHISEKENDYDKINEAYFLGGHEQAVKALERNLNLHIDDYATFNWKAVVDAINVLGGVDIEISDKEENGRLFGGKRMSRVEREQAIERLTREMKEAARILEFEHAAFLRDQIDRLRRGENPTTEGDAPKAKRKRGKK